MEIKIECIEEKIAGIMNTPTPYTHLVTLVRCNVGIPVIQGDE
jgi:hypothetical protein